MPSKVRAPASKSSPAKAQGASPSTILNAKAAQSKSATAPGGSSPTRRGKPSNGCAKPDLNARVQEIVNRLKASQQVVYDSETSGLDWRKNHICGHVFSFGPAPSDSYYIPVRHL